MDELNERSCPHCKHEVLDWGLPCPGCGQIPRQTEEGRKLMGERRARWLWADWAFIGAIVVLAYFATLVFVGGRGKKDALPAPATTTARAQTNALSPSH